jgi:putative PIN family toxin of toxin-antitoxin system
MLRVVYDTNVIVSAVLKAESLPAALLVAALRDRVTLCVSQTLLDEYEAVLHRPKFGFRAESVEALLRDIAAHSLLVHPVERIMDGVDAGDAHVLECAVAAQARFLVTGNIKHFPAPIFRHIRIVTPAECAPFLLP